VKNRNNLEIIALILEIAKGRRATQIRIMYKAYLSYVQLKEYLSQLLENGLITYQEGERTYNTTEKGLHFLRIYQQISEAFVTTRSSIATAG
jgi:predicted transcriptional regulator